MLQLEHMKKPSVHLFCMTPVRSQLFVVKKKIMVFLHSCLKKPIEVLNVVFKQVNTLPCKCFTRVFQKHLLVSNNFHHWEQHTKKALHYQAILVRLHLVYSHLLKLYTENSDLTFLALKASLSNPYWYSCRGNILSSVAPSDILSHTTVK